MSRDRLLPSGLTLNALTLTRAQIERLGLTTLLRLPRPDNCYQLWIQISIRPHELLAKQIQTILDEVNVQPIPKFGPQRSNLEELDVRKDRSTNCLAGLGRRGNVYKSDQVQ